MYVAVRAEVESVDVWREQFKTHNELFKKQGVSIAYMGATEDNKVLAIFDTNDLDAFIKVFNICCFRCFLDFIIIWNSTK